MSNIVLLTSKLLANASSFIKIRKTYHVPTLHKVISLELSWHSLQTLGKKPKSKDQGKLFRISSARKMPRRVIAPPFVYCLDHNCLETAKKVLQNIVHQASGVYKNCHVARASRPQ